MQFGFVISTGTPREVGELAGEAEAAGWDGAFYWDGMAVGDGIDIYDPWVVLAVMALRTERVRLGLMVTPPSRRRPWKLAREVVTLDHLSHGRMVLPVGLGAVDDVGFGGVGEATDRRERAELLDESLEIISGLSGGGRFDYQGKHYTIEGFRFAPQPVQRPRVPIWVVAAYPRPKSLARALQYDGIIPTFANATDPFRQETADELLALRQYIAANRSATTPFDIIVEGVTPGDDPAAAAAIVGPRAAAGATWWIESRWENPNGIADLRRRIRQGPPRVEG